MGNKGGIEGEEWLFRAWMGWFRTCSWLAGGKFCAVRVLLGLFMADTWLACVDRDLLAGVGELLAWHSLVISSFDSMLVYLHIYEAGRYVAFESLNGMFTP